MRGFEAHVVVALVAAGSGPVLAEERVVEEIPYVTCDGGEWRASLDGDRFWHTPLQPGPGAEAHADTVIHYKTWDSTCWSARWDSDRRRFDHSPIGSGRAHPDTILNFIDWDGANWTARRDRDEWIVRRQ